MLVGRWMCFKEMREVGLCLPWMYPGSNKWLRGGDWRGMGGIMVATMTLGPPNHTEGEVQSPAGGVAGARWVRAQPLPKKVKRTACAEKQRAMEDGTWAIGVVVVVIVHSQSNSVV